MKERLRRHFHAALGALHRRLRLSTPRIIGSALQQIEAGGDVVVIAFGKAARPMAEAWLTAPIPVARVRGLLVTPEGDDGPLPPFEVIPGGHPLPTEGSFRAARRALELCRGAQPKDDVTFLVSGGGSAMLELPIDPSIDVDEWRTFYRALVGCGASIHVVNRIRRRLSAVKGGRLAVAAGRAASRTTIVVRDVRGGPDDVASGPTGSFDLEPDTLLGDLRRWHLLPALPAGLRAAVEQRSIPLLPEVVGFSAATVLDESFAHHALCGSLDRDGFVVDDRVDVDDWSIPRAVEQLWRRLIALHRRHPGRDVAIVTTGELSVPLPPSPGTGGRNQQFALACARRIRGRPITVLSCGTDGVDGNSPAAGAIVDGTTMARARRLNLDVHDALRRCDAFPLLHALGDTVITGPTGTNVRDVRILVHHR